MAIINPKVLEIGQMNLSGNMIPEPWYKNIIRGTGKPYLTAIIILADIIYWYKPTVIRNEHTGEVIEYRQKFKADMLQKSYDELSNKFGISKPEAVRAVKHLEGLGVIKRVFRTINKFPNTMFIDIFPKEIQKISIFTNEQLIKNLEEAEKANLSDYISR